MAQTKLKSAPSHSEARNLISKPSNAFFNVLLIAACFVTVFPLWIIIVSSFTSEYALTTYGYRLWPLEFSVNAYSYLFRDGSIMITAYKNTI
ncbi:MAG: carbohydrate ABC transporter permease, partial [Clostridia bacterium]|nr:carbohydrate ABC transporter permease [Clostridia bacterium]